MQTGQRLSEATRVDNIRAGSSLQASVWQDLYLSFDFEFHPSPPVPLSLAEAIYHSRGSNIRTQRAPNAQFIVQWIVLILRADIQGTFVSLT